MLTTLITHSGLFQTDEVFATAMIKILYPSIEIIRTRDDITIRCSRYNPYHIVIDVGMVYEPEQNNFDHHQPDLLVRDNNIPYSSAGLIWKHFGTRIIEKIIGPENEFIDKIYKSIDHELIEYIDNVDNGKLNFQKYRNAVLLTDIINSYNLSYCDVGYNQDSAFHVVVSLAEQIIIRKIMHSLSRYSSVSDVKKAYNESVDKRIIVIKPSKPWKGVLCYTDAMLVVYQDSYSFNWAVHAVPVNPKTFTVKIKFPLEWGGLVNEKLEQITNIPGSIFCHKNRYICINKTEEGAMKMAKLALEHHNAHLYK